MMRKIISDSGKTGFENDALTRFISLLRQHFPDISARYQIKSLGLFGSFVSGQPKKGSDLDILVEFHESPSLFKFLALERELSDLVGLKVDLVMKEALKPRIGERIIREVVAV
jgi:hypothetical protein